VYVGRFQPPHAAHIGTVRRVLGQAGRVLVLLGSANLARSVRNPFSAGERVGMFRAALREAGADVRRVVFRPLPDRFDADAWAVDVRALAGEVFGSGARVALVGFEKDASSAYLRWFPGWERLNAPELPGLNATDLRAAFLTGQPLPDTLPGAVYALLQAFARTPAFARLRAEWEAVEAARAALPPGARLHEERWLHMQGGRVWLHTRREAIGRGLWELPGHLLPPGQGPGFPGGAVFDHPARALVAPTTARVHPGPLPARFPARPVPLEVALTRPRRFHEDHQVILSRLLSQFVAYRPCPASVRFLPE